MRKTSALSFLLIAGLLVGLASTAGAQRRIIGSDDEDGTPPADAGPPPPPANVKKKDDKKKDDKKKGEEKKDDKAKPDAKSTKKDDKRDVLEESAADLEKKKKDDEARKAAEASAEAAAEAAKKKKEEDDKRLREEKKAAEDKKKLENRDQRLASARKIRQFTRTTGDLSLSFAVSPGEVKAGEVIEVRVAVEQKLSTADPKYGNLMPMKGLDLVAIVSQPTGKGAPPLRYVLHPLDAPGRYGFHLTVPKNGQLQVAVEGDVKGKSLALNIPLHVGTWPPPDFDDEEKNNAAAAGEASRAGRRIID